MPNKRSRRQKTKKYICPYCEERLWRLGNSKHYLFYKDALEIRSNTGISLNKAKLLLLQNSTFLDKSKWIEAFCCSKHGMMWLKVFIEGDGYKYSLAQEKDWLQTNRTLDPRVSNPSVSEYTLRMSRKLRYQ